MRRMVKQIRWFAVIAVVALTACETGAADGPRSASAGALTGRLLVASPRMPDPRFAHTVILIVRHDARGAMGLVINRAVARGPIAKVLEDIGLAHAGMKGDIDIHYGGPVEPDKAFVLHSPDYVGSDTVAVTRDISMSATPSVLTDIGAGSGPRRVLFAIGYAGWSAGQLDAEIERKDWVSVPADDEFVFDSAFATKWRRALARHGVDL